MNRRTNSTTWKCKNSARWNTICECSKCRIVWCDFPLSSTHRHWNWLLTGDLWMFFYVLFVCVWRKCYEKLNDSSHNFMNWLWDPRRSIDDHSILLTNIFNSVEKHSNRPTIVSFCWRTFNCRASNKMRISCNRNQSRRFIHKSIANRKSTL